VPAAYSVGSLADLSLGALVALVNGAYGDYPGPFSPETPAGYAEFCRVQQIDFARSVVAHDAGGAAIGFGLLGLRGARAWCAEFGVLPAWRRQGAGAALLAALLAAARKAGATDVRLEVAGANAVAQRLYARAGFRPVRPLHNYAAPAGQVLGAADPPPGLVIAPVPARALATPSDLPADPAPAWDHELPALLVDGGGTLLASAAGRPAGLLHYTGRPGEVEIRALALRPADLATARALLHASGVAPAGRLVVAYVGAASPLAPLWPRLGFTAIASDLEMQYDFAPIRGA